MDGVNQAGNRSLQDIAREISARRSRGELPRFDEYAGRFPELAAELREMFRSDDDADKTTSPADDVTVAHVSRLEAAACAPQLERLGEFRILGMIGRGGMGVVYQAQQESLSRKVALKVLPSSALLSPGDVLRFKREAQAAARLHHTNIVPVHGVGEDQGIHFYVMQYIEGRGLDAIIAELRRPRASPDCRTIKPARPLRTPPTRPPASPATSRPASFPGSIPSLTPRSHPAPAALFRNAMSLGLTFPPP